MTDQVAAPEAKEVKELTDKELVEKFGKDAHDSGVPFKFVSIKTGLPVEVRGFHSFLRETERLMVVNTWDRNYRIRYVDITRNTNVASYFITVAGEGTAKSIVVKIDL